MRIRIPIFKRLYFSIFILVIATLTAMEFTRSATTYSSNTTMNATILFAIAVTPSSALSEGIQFGSLNPGKDNYLAWNDTTNQYHGLNFTNANATDYNLTVDSSSTYNVDFYNKAQYEWLNNTDDERIMIQNVTLEANLSVTGDNVNYTKAYEPNAVNLNTTWIPIGSESTHHDTPCNDTANDGSGICNMIYFLDVPSSQPSGTYNTTYCYCAVEVGSSNYASVCSC